MSEKNKLPNGTAERPEEIDLRRLVGELVDNKWLIIAITSLFTVLSLLYVLFATPVYETDALVQVERNVGNTLLTDISSILPDSQPQSQAEIELIQSRMVMGKTIQDLGLESLAAEKYFPVFGRGWARLTDKEPAKIALTRLSVPEKWLNKPLELTVADNNQYHLTADGTAILNGKIGQFESRGGFSLLVSDIKADVGTTFYVMKRTPLEVMQEMSKNLTVADKGKDTGVLGLTYAGTDPVLIQKILNSIAQNYLQQNVERKSEEAGKSLKFLELQLPKVRGQLEIAEDKLNSYRQRKDSVDMSLEAKSLLDSVVSVESEMNQLTLKEAEISQLYTKDHPAYKSLLDKRQTLQNERDRFNKRISGMPATQQEILRLTRDVQAGQEIYMELLNKQQELSISKASTIGNVRIVDNAITSPNPVSPKKTLMVLLFTFLGALISSGVVFLRALLHKGVETPDEIEELGISVYASIPISETQQKKDMLFSRSKGRSKHSDMLLALANPADLAVESIRSLRTSLHFAMMEAKNNVLMISGASPEIGKTFVCSNLAAVIAQSGMKVLLIDGDMRRGRVHEVMHVSNDKGLSAVLSGQVSIQDSLCKTDVEMLDFIPRGKVPPNPSELLMNKRFSQLLEWAQERYDLVLVDTPPILAVTDASIVGRHAGTNMMVTRFGVTTQKEVEVSISRFENSGVEIKGVIFNAIVKKASSYYGYGYYNYGYESKSE